MQRLHQKFQQFLVPFYFGLWYALNVAYNITNKWALQDVHDIVSAMELKKANGLQQENPGYVIDHKASALPITIGCLQFLIGSIYACSLWMIGWRRPIPHADELAVIIKSFPQKAKIFATDIRQICSNPSNCLTSWHAATSSSSSSISLRHTFHIAVHHTFGQLCTVLSLSANSISFAHVIKAMEPLFSALASFLFLGQRMDIRVYLSLIPVVGGVVMACAGSREFSWLAFSAGMGSNAFFAMRGVVSKIAMEETNVQSDKHSEGYENNALLKNVTKNSDHDEEQEVKDHPRQKHMSPANLFAAVTCISFFLSIPLVFLFEGGILRDLIIYSPWTEGRESDATTKGHELDDKHNFSRTFTYIITSGLFHYLNNEVMYLVLSNVHPITLAVGNTMKRVFIIVAGTIVFSTPTTLQTALGSAIGIGGVFVYSMMKQWYDLTGKNEVKTHMSFENIKWISLKMVQIM